MLNGNLEEHGSYRYHFAYQKPFVLVIPSSEKKIPNCVSCTYFLLCTKITEVNLSAVVS